MRTVQRSDNVWNSLETFLPLIHLLRLLTSHLPSHLAVGPERQVEFGRTCEQKSL